MIKEVEFHGWKALSLTTGHVELIIPTDIGPRIISCSLDGGKNLFATFDDQLGGRGEAEFKVRGGHRLWHAPEDPVRTYQPDNSPVVVKLLGDAGVELAEKTENATGIEKRMAVEAINPTSFRITHTLFNHNMWPVNIAAWGVTQLRHDGFAALPLAQRLPHTEKTLLPNMALAMWPYTDFSKPSWQMHSGYIGIDVSKASGSQKVGLTSFPGWAACWTPDGTFVKYYKIFAPAIYPDLGSRFEAYTCDVMIEFESLSPLVEVPAGGHIEHVEYWGLVSGLQKPDTDKVFTGKFRPVIEHWLEHTHV
jgi:hypothetical protein